MTKRIITMSLVLCLILSLSTVLNPVAVNAVQSKPAVSSQKVNTARFLNMLNHNFVYGEAFDYTDDLINDSVIALLDRRDNDNEDFISEDIVRGYVKDMYGVEIADFSGLNDGFPKSDGYVFIIPRGFSTYRHTLADYRENEDGSYTVTTNVTVTDHDGTVENTKAVTLFVKNEDSAFGYNIIYSELLTDSTEA